MNDRADIEARFLKAAAALLHAGKKAVEAFEKRGFFSGGRIDAARVKKTVPRRCPTTMGRSASRIAVRAMSTALPDRRGHFRPLAKTPATAPQHPSQGRGTVLPSCNAAQRSLACRGVRRSLFTVWHDRPLARAGVRRCAVAIGKVTRRCPAHHANGAQRFSDCRWGDEHGASMFNGRSAAWLAVVCGAPCLQCGTVTPLQEQASGAMP